MPYEAKIHDAQTSILRELLFNLSAGYAELQKPTQLSSDHFNFHIMRLVEIGYVEKVVKGKYRLTPKGKEYANKLDTAVNTIERQPKCAVILGIEHDGKWLLQERLKHPYYGFWGFPSGKIRWGETILETAARELMEETGLTANHKYMGVYHEQVDQADSGESLEDKIFHIIHCSDVKGNLIDRFEGGHNAWMTVAQAKKQPKIFDSIEFEFDIALGKTSFLERRTTYTKEVF
jgi:ADP-ribose pyrophosphatase YjhB (NUDIX family)